MKPNLTDLARYVAGLIALEAFAMSSNGAGPVDGSTDDAKVTSLVRLLEETPAWISVDPQDEATRRKIISSYERICEADTALLRNAVHEFWDQYCSPKSTKTNLRLWREGKARIFLLNRFAFAVPERWPADPNMSFGEFVPPADKNGVNLLWPLEKDEKGRLVLKPARIEAYVGPGYDGLADFDFMAKTFPRRGEGRQAAHDGG